MMRRQFIQFVRTIICILLIFSAAISCKRQTIFDPELLLSNIPILIDWSKSVVPEENINSVSAYFYPIDGSEPIVMNSVNPYLITAKIPEGVYDIIVHNEMAGNIKGVRCSSVSNFSNYVMKIEKADIENVSSMFYKPAANEQLINECEPVASWSYKGFEVTRDMIEYTRSKAFNDIISKLRSKTKFTKSEDVLTSSATKSTTKSLEDLNGIQPTPLTATYKVVIEIENMNNIQFIECVIDGFVDGTIVEAQEKIAATKRNYTYFTPSDHCFNPNSKTNGNVYYTFTNFGHKQNNSNTEYKMIVNIILHSGELHSETFDVTDAINNYIVGEIINISIGNKYDNGTQDIVLPRNTGAGFGVGEWGDAENVIL